MKFPQQKIFCIGMNKTGTTSIGDALSILGYRRFGWKPSISSGLTLRWHEGNIDKFVDISKEYDVFEDIPWPFVYKEMYDLYPNAKFILTERTTTESWLISIQKHISRGQNWVGHYLIYGSYNPVSDASKYMARYVEHNKEVKDFFKDKPGALLEMCFERGDGWEKLCPFLGVDSLPSEAFPHSNQAPS